MKGVLVKGAKHAMQSTVGAGAGLVSDSSVNLSCHCQSDLNCH